MPDHVQINKVNRRTNPRLLVACKGSWKITSQPMLLHIILSQVEDLISLCFISCSFCWTTLVCQKLFLYGNPSHSASNTFPA